ncbi:MAG: Fic family protein [Acidimicrobiales bacterium]
MEVWGYADAARWVYGQAVEPGDWRPDAPLALTELRHAHELALGPVWGVARHPNATPGEKPGSFREHDIQPFPGGMAPPSWVEVPAAMADWVRSLGSITSAENVIERIAAAHGEFERVHPFLDGNGRTARLVMNLLLVRCGYPPAIVYTRDRTDTSTPFGEPTRETQAHSAKWSHAPCSTTCTGSWCLRCLGPAGSSRWRRWPPRTGASRL